MRSQRLPPEKLIFLGGFSLSGSTVSLEWGKAFNREGPADSRKGREAGMVVNTVDRGRREIMECKEFTYSLEDLREMNRIHLTKGQRVYSKLKRGLDIICSTVGIVVLSPVFLVTAAAIKLESPKENVIFKQKRIGRSEDAFYLYKFRSMRSDSPQLSTSEFVNAERYITKVGKFIRKTSIDELPQLWNVLQGDMALVGPRPLLPKEEEVHFLRNYYGIYQVRPGITGLAQINGRDAVDDYNKVRLDRAYVRNVSLFLDLKILWRTAFKVVKSEGVVDDKKEKQVVLSGNAELDEEDYQNAIRCYSEARR